MCHCILDAETKQQHETATVRPVNTKHPNYRLGVPTTVPPPKHEAKSPKDEEDGNPEDLPELTFDNVRIPVIITSKTDYEPELIHEPEAEPSPEMLTSQEKGGIKHHNLRTPNQNESLIRNLQIGEPQGTATDPQTVLETKTKLVTRECAPFSLVSQPWLSIS